MPSLEMRVRSTDLFVFDLDGTLVHSDPKTGTRRVPEVLVKSVQRIAAQASIVIATGRRYRAAQVDFEFLPPMNYCIVHNGLVVKDAEGKTVHRHGMKMTEALEVAQMIQTYGLDSFFVSDNHAVDFLFLEEAFQKSESLQAIHEKSKKRTFALKTLEEILKLTEFDIVEVAVIGPHRQLFELKNFLSEKLPKDLRAMIVKNIGVEKWGALEVLPAHGSKWTGIEWVAQKLGSSRIIAIGDDENDIEMIRSAHFGVAMHHAESHIRESADHIVEGSEGLAKFLDAFNFG